MILKLFKSRDKPGRAGLPGVKDGTAGSAYQVYFGGSIAGKTVNERTSLDYGQ